MQVKVFFSQDQHYYCINILMSNMKNIVLTKLLLLKGPATFTYSEQNSPLKNVNK